jgi:hypothetical protein
MKPEVLQLIEKCRQLKAEVDKQKKLIWPDNTRPGNMRYRSKYTKLVTELHRAESQLLKSIY